MSLISEALRKARQEAAEREAREQGLETPVVAGYWKRGGRLGQGLVLGAAIAICAAVIGGGLVWWLLVDGPDSAVVEALAEVDDVPVQVSEEASAPEVEGLSSEAQPENTIPTEGLESSQIGEVPVQPQLGTGPEIGAPEPTRHRVDHGPVMDPEVQAKSNDGEFVGEAHIGEVTLTLDYLVFRKDNPFAQINGRDVRVGAVVEDFVVEEITPDAVVLTRGDAKVVLRVQ